jgi:glycosyltransferase involved in cell wall biosynthesis
VDNPLKVLVTTQSYPRHRDDSHGAFIASHAEALHQGGIEVAVLVPAVAKADDAYSPFVVHRFRYGPRRLEVLAGTGAMHHAARGPAALMLPNYVIANSMAARRHSIDASVVHAHWWVPTGLATVAGTRAGTPVVIHVHGTDAAIAPAGSLRGHLAAAVLRRADKVLAVSTALAAWVQAVSGIDAEVAPMPLDRLHIADLAPAPTDGPVLAVGRLVGEKGFDVAIRAVARSGQRLVLVGDGPQRRSLEKLALEVRADVTFLGSVAPSQIADLYRMAKVVVVPSRREGFGLVAAEASASGRAVVASRVGGLTDIVRDGVNGNLIEPDDVEALAAALLALDPQLGANGPALMASLSPAAAADRERKTYESLLR